MINTVSLLVTTYNWVEALERVLLSVSTQSHLPKEVIIADDGSDDLTAELIQSLQGCFPTQLIHCWQKDEGFRAAAIRNKAIAKMTSDYVLMIDGDMVLHPRFVEDHLSAAKRGYFVQGSRVITAPDTANKMLSGSIAKLHVFSRGISNRLNALNSPLLSSFVSTRDTAIRSTKTCNFSAWRDDLLEINGFDEDYIGWGREDSDLVARLLHVGKKRYKLKCMANAYHLYHLENTRESLSKNDGLLERCLAEKHTRCSNGIDKNLGGR
ncbi:MAG: glycosyltransferase involved in cell wall biosynthesis [Kiritimatiellia bacterium]|jgi:glycosyltransferase involved in cell wall biosynthesis